MEKKKIIKKTDFCIRCGFFNPHNNFCRQGLGWKYIVDPKSDSCSKSWTIPKERCGKCKYFEQSSSSTLGGGYCTERMPQMYMNFFDTCDNYTQEPGKDIEPLPENVPEFVKTKYNL